MCIIIWSPKGDFPKKDILTAMECHPDGWGFAVAAGRKVRTYKSVDPKQFLEAWVNRVKGPTLFHARWATHGAVNNDNCHPFEVRGHGLVAAHNGILNGYGNPKKSDTRDFLTKVIEPLPTDFVYEQPIVEALEAHIGGSKIVFLDRLGQVTILNEKLGVWYKERWYSNTTVLR